MVSMHGNNSSSNSRRGRILPDSRADVEAAMAAVLARSASVKLESPQRRATNQGPNTRRSSVDFSKDRSRIERRQPSVTPNSNPQRSLNDNKLDASTLKSVSEYIGKLNSGRSLVKKKKRQKSTPQKSIPIISALDDDDDPKKSIPKISLIDNDDDSSDDSYGVGNLDLQKNVDLQSISAMIDKVSKQNSPNRVKAIQARTHITAQKPRAVRVIQQDLSVSSDEDSDDNFNSQNLDMINAMIDKVKNKPSTVTSPKTMNEISATIQSPSSDISSDDSSIGNANISAATQANLALYIDSLNAQKKEAPRKSEEINATKSISKDTQMHRDTRHEKTTSNLVSSSNRPIPASILTQQENKFSGFNDRTFTSGLKPRVNTFMPTQSTTSVARKKPQSKQISPNLKSSTYNPIVRRVSGYDDIKLQSYIKKAKEVAKKDSPTFTEVEYIIIYARRDGIPIKPILTALDEGCKGPANSFISDKSSPSKGLFSTARTVSSDVALLELDDDALDTFLNNDTNELTMKASVAGKEQSTSKLFSMAHRNIQKLVFYINEAISLIENNLISEATTSELTTRAMDDEIDDTLLREILNNPAKHIQYEEKEEHVVLLSDESNDDQEESRPKDDMYQTEDPSTDEQSVEEEEEEVELEQHGSAESLHVVKFEDEGKLQEVDNTVHVGFEVEDSLEIEVGIDEFKKAIGEETRNAVHESKPVQKNSVVGFREPVNQKTFGFGFKEPVENKSVRNALPKVGVRNIVGTDLKEENEENNFFFDDEHSASSAQDPSEILFPNAPPQPPSDLQARPSLDVTTRLSSDALPVPVTSNDVPSVPTTTDQDDFFLQVESLEPVVVDDSEKGLNFRQTFMVRKMKQLDRAKQYADGKAGRTTEKVHRDGTKTVTEIIPHLSPVMATKRLFTKKTFSIEDFPRAVPDSYKEQWKMKPKKRLSMSRPLTITRSSHRESLRIATVVGESAVPGDELSWDNRDVNQFFIGDVDLIDKANWLGIIQPTRLNDKMSDPVVQPQSITVEGLACPDKWDEEWYTTWYTRKNNPNKAGLQREERLRRSKRSKKNVSRRSKGYYEDDDEDEMKDNEIDEPDIPIIGNIYTLRFRGENASRVHLSFISYVSKSRWKQKYFPRGIFSHN